MKLHVFLLWLFFATPFLDAQTLTGFVYDLKTKLPISGVEVYLNETLFHVTTDANGKFELNVGTRINTGLIFRYSTYQVKSISDPYGKDLSKIYLEEIVPIDKAMRTDPFSREQKMKVFREHFLGVNKAGKSCKILNEDDIQFFYDSDTKNLSAVSNQPLIIENKYLGYRIQFDITRFDANFNKVSLDNNDLIKSDFSGTSFFIDMNPNNKKIKKQRDEAYVQLPRYFLRNLVRNTLKASNYQLLYKEVIANPSIYFIVTDALYQKQVRINPDVNPSEGEKIDELIYLEMGILDEKKKRSDIYFYSDSFLVDQYGNTNTVDKIRFTGHYGQRYIGNMLPLDYEYEDQNVAFAASYVNTDRLKEMNAGILFGLILEPHRGKVVYLNFWGTWCIPCQDQMAHMNALREELKGKDVIFMYLASNSHENTWKNFILNKGLVGDNVVHYRLSDTQQRGIERNFSLGQEAFPVYMLIDRNGKIVNTNADPPMQKEAIIRQIEKLLAK